MTLKIPKPPSQRSIRNQLAFMGGSAQMEAPSARAGKRGRQPESKVNDAVKEWARYRGGVLYRNRRGMVQLPSGGQMPVGLGPNGYGDNVGYLTITVTPAMVGRRVAVFAMIESKVRGGADDHQLMHIEAVRDAGGIAGCANNAEDCERILLTWKEGR
jgi:hypothetical protein